MLVAALDILRPIADVLILVEDQVGWAGHVMFAFSFAHEVMGTVAPVLMVANVAIRFGTNDLVGCACVWEGEIIFSEMLFVRLIRGYLRSLVV